MYLKKKEPNQEENKSPEIEENFSQLLHPLEKLNKHYAFSKTNAGRQNDFQILFKI